MLRAKKSCPMCGCPDLYRSRRRLYEKGILHFLGWIPFRCVACDHRFYARTERISEGQPAEPVGRIFSRIPN